MTAPIMAIRRTDGNLLEKSLGYRFTDLIEFLGFGRQNVELIHAAAPHRTPVLFRILWTPFT